MTRLTALATVLVLGAALVGCQDKEADPNAGQDHAADDAADDPHAGHDHDADPHPEDDPAAHANETPPLTEQALANLGVTSKRVYPTDFVRTVRVQAAIVDAPLNTRAIGSSLGGIVTQLHVTPGDVVRAGEPLVTVSRAAIPRPELALTGTLVPALSEDLHAAIANQRKAANRLAVVEQELDRIRKFAETGTESGLPVLPRKTLIDLQYEHTSAELELNAAKRELERHGLSVEEIHGIVAGGRPPANDRLWKRALQANGFWSEHEDATLEALPKETRRVPWVVGALGELVASGHGGPELAQAVAASEPLRKRFVEAVSLLLEGHTVERVRLLAESGALDAMSVVRAPKDVPDWDVESIAVQPGQRVEAGAQLLELHDARTMWMRVEPIGDELTLVTRAFSAGDALTATALLAGSAPDLTDLRIDRLATRGGEHERGAAATIVCSNTPLTGAEGGTSRSWALREGLRYLVHVPVAKLEKRFVLPADAITAQGVETVVFVKDGDHFHITPVHLEHRDEEVAVIANDGAIKSGDAVCVTGAFALGLALQAGDGAVDPHAGHDH